MRQPIVKNNLLRGQSGVTLVELIVSMVIISIALGGVLMVMNFTTSHSADPMIQHQAVAIAEAYMEEILLQSYDNPSGGYTGTQRDQFDDVSDYSGLHDVGAKDQQGGAITGLESYTVDVAVATTTLNGVSAKKITLTVTRGTAVTVSLVGYRTDYD